MPFPAEGPIPAPAPSASLGMSIALLAVAVPVGADADAVVAGAGGALPSSFVLVPSAPTARSARCWRDRCSFGPTRGG